MGFEQYARVEEHVRQCRMRSAEEETSKRFVTMLIGGDNRVRVADLGTFHRTLTQRLSFTVAQADQRFVLPGGWHIFYRFHHLLVRVKTTGTFIRPRPHATMSLAVGLGWQDELQKYGGSGGGQPRAITRLDPKLWRWAERASNWEENWAADVHFDFPQPFDASAAPGIAAHAAPGAAR